MAYLALSPVSAAVYAVLNVAAVTNLATGGVVDDIPQKPSFPLVFIEVLERDIRGFGGGGFPEVELRVHVYTQAEGMKDGQAITQQVIALLRDATLTVSGYTQAGKVFYDETVPLPNEQIHGVKVQELVSTFRIYVEE